jgi:hypothetical protein
VVGWPDDNSEAARAAQRAAPWQRVLDRAEDNPAKPVLCCAEDTLGKRVVGQADDNPGAAVRECVLCCAEDIVPRAAAAEGAAGATPERAAVGATVVCPADDTQARATAAATVGERVLCPAEDTPEDRSGGV